MRSSSASTGLKGFPQAIESVFPEARIQLCIVHLVRASLNYVSWKERKQVAGDLGISEITVKIHRGAAMHKMGARTLADLVRMADGVKSGRRKPER